ncbi:dTDP-4-dehydrorhamnose reductase [Burkholderia cenocepacia]|jgi:dTDP-4-dehydrorhamnose reductase|uniref:dTDP-4-dehydrorhamnose reductase n=1 Tax=Burkholderia cenocepacia TaxID=95486 RepID=UPI00073AC305|nr:dTDP-4-dehydrorhamnose reductase [Burkholderia cenocepacia]ALV57065.1 dTDP-4-dehydrorhamnose reductase [Burkholderia cenocepacia]AQQ48922.1 dTDP-4-dehydrorhamnose reductase [Burkholderia cenocepacia]MBR8264581.1 dTDP-4-dehydrorhamnose reductase [Burkholderia cenocepacia]ONI93748.1 dTDP-4-dehydrorhamnose reductase [Burkholderia cenocepacia]ONJ10011.1 dTDP-4-dehydrorhamnose reductase [Burkholderia cenocepacia]
MSDCGVSVPEQRTILLTGANGQVGFELARSLQGLGRVIACDRRQLDLADLDGIRDAMRALRPALVVNAAAYTAVADAERDVTGSMRINADAPRVLAEEAKRVGAALVHYSTDYVFDGRKMGAYVEDDAPAPLNAYGRSKLAGEEAIRGTGCDHLTFRTSWVYDLRSNNFLTTMLRIGAERPELRVVSDQFGAPTWSYAIASLTAQVLAQAIAAGRMPERWSEWWSTHTGVYHLTAMGETSWHGFAEAIFAASNCTNKPSVIPIDAASYPGPVLRPANSLLSNDKLACAFGLRAPDWRFLLNLCLADAHSSRDAERNRSVA